MTDTHFHGWSPSALEFFRGLQADNSKTYWTEHKPLYEAEVRAPMLALITQLAPRYGPPKMLRPYRDTRFSKDKTVYRTSIAARLGAGYVELGREGLTAGSGEFHLAGPTLTRYRTAVDAGKSGEQLADIIETIKANDIQIAGTTPLAGAPRGYKADHPRIELLRYKGIIAYRKWPVEPWLHTSAAADRVAGLLDAVEPLQAWLREHVGVSSRQ